VINKAGVLTCLGLLILFLRPLKLPEVPSLLVQIPFSGRSGSECDIDEMVKTYWNAEERLQNIPRLPTYYFFAAVALTFIAWVSTLTSFQKVFFFTFVISSL